MIFLVAELSSGGGGAPTPTSSHHYFDFFVLSLYVSSCVYSRNFVYKCLIKWVFVLLLIFRFLLQRVAYNIDPFIVVVNS